MKNKQHGFSLIEFLVASGIAVIVILAAGSTYFTTMKLNRTATDRLQVQQDLRSVANMIARDARQAGTFGCVNIGAGVYNAPAGTGIPDPSPSVSTYTGLRASDNPQANAYGVMLVPAEQLKTKLGSEGQSGITLRGNALVFFSGSGNEPVVAVGADNSLRTLSMAMQRSSPVYNYISEGPTLSDNSKPIVISSCNEAQAFIYDRSLTAQKTGNLYIKQNCENTKDGGTAEVQNCVIRLNKPSDYPLIKPGQVGSVSGLSAVAYAIGKADSEDSLYSLYRFVKDIDGIWRGPQLIVSSITEQGMQIQFGYVKAAQCDGTVAEPNEEFRFFDKPTLTADYGKLPALIRVILNIANTDEIESNVGQVEPVIIDAAVRGGNICANRGVQSQTE